MNHSETLSSPASQLHVGPSIAVSALPHIGMLGFDGEDAASFLQSQLSNDVNALAIGGAHWTSYNSPKGRMLGSLLLVRIGAREFRAFVAADLAEALRKRLSIFVMRAKVAVVDLSESGVRFGISGPNAGTALANGLGIQVDVGKVVVMDDLTVAKLPDGRVLMHMPSARAEDVLDRLGQPVDPAPRWDHAGIVAGVPHITHATQDLFVPQSVNWDLVGGINFQKGCYPGQEIVARMQYLGRLKERLLRFHVGQGRPTPGERLYGDTFGEQACGTVVNAAPAPESGWDFLAVVQWAALSGSIHLGSTGGPVPTPRAMAYPVPAPAAPDRPKL